MTAFTMSTSLVFGYFRVELRDYAIEERGETDGSSASRVLGPPRWSFSMRSPDTAGMSESQAAVWQDQFMSLRGRINHLGVWDINRAAPRGSLRGSTLTLSTTPAIGAATIVVNAGVSEAGTTLFVGDYLQVGTGVGSQLFMVVTGGTANGSGVISVDVVPNVRPGTNFVGGSTPVFWDKPKAYTKLTGNSFGWDYIPGLNTRRGFAVDLLENWQT